MTGPDGEAEVRHILYRLGEEQTSFRDPDQIEDIDADYAETINVSKLPYLPPAKIMAL